MAVDALLGLVFVPILAAAAVVALPGRGRWVAVVLTWLLLPLLAGVLTAGVAAEGTLRYALAGFAPPLGIRLVADPLALVFVWTGTAVGVLAGLRAGSDLPPDTPRGQRFWPLYLLLLGATNGAFLSADLFNLYVLLELVTLAAIALIALAGKAEALRAAMRYLLLAMLGSLAYLLGVGIVYGRYGVLDLYQLADMVTADPATVTALSLMTLGLVLKSAIFPLHLWLPPAHGNAPGSVSAVLSGVVVKVSVYILYRMWLWTAGGLDWAAAADLLGLLGTGAVLYGSVLALFQTRLKLLLAYSTVAQLGYLMLFFPLASVEALHAASYQVLAHGLAKAALFLVAGDILRSLGTDRLTSLTRLDQKMPVQLFIFGLAGVSLMGLPPSGGFLAKWMLLEAAWAREGWGWMAVIVIGSLLAAGYVYRVLAIAFFHPDSPTEAPVRRAPSRMATLGALSLAVLAIVIGFTSAPILALLNRGLPPVLIGGGS